MMTNEFFSIFKFTNICIFCVLLYYSHFLNNAPILQCQNNTTNMIVLRIRLLNMISGLMNFDRYVQSCNHHHNQHISEYTNQQQSGYIQEQNLTLMPKLQQPAAETNLGCVITSPRSQTTICNNQSRNSNNNPCRNGPQISRSSLITENFPIREHLKISLFSTLYCCMVLYCVFVPQFIQFIFQ